MSYLVLARKWRPQTFETIRGQEHIVRALRNAITSNRIAHAYVFSGIRGVGKTSAARVLAKALNCAEGPTPSPCDKCASCTDIKAGKSVDVFEIDGASSTGVDDVRRLKEAVQYPPVKSKHRIYIIDEVHMLSTAAFNALLKTLEEPPKHVIFIFATTDPQKIPLTILSRCQQFDFKRLTLKELISLLKEISEAEGIEVDEKSLVAMASEADGSVRDAQSIFDQVISYSGKKIVYQDLKDVLGVVDRDLLMNIAAAVITRNPRAVMECVAEAEKFGYDPERFAGDLLSLFRDLSILKAVKGGENLISLSPEETETALRLLEKTSWEDAHALFDILNKGFEKLRIASRPASVLEMTLLKMTMMPPILPLSEILAKVRSHDFEPSDKNIEPCVEKPSQQIERLAVPPGVQNHHGPKKSLETSDKNICAAPEQTEPAVEAIPENTEKTLPKPFEKSQDEYSDQEESSSICAEKILEAPEAWKLLLTSIEKSSRPLWGILSVHAKLSSWDPVSSKAVILYDDPGHGFFLKPKVEEIASALKSITGHPFAVALKCETTPRLTKGESNVSEARNIRRAALSHSLVKKTTELFGGEVEEVRVVKT